MMLACRRVAYLCALASCLAAFAAAPNPGMAADVACEVRGTWLNPPAFSSPERRAKTLDTVVRANLNTLLLLAPPIGDNRGWSTHENFSAMLRDAKAVGLSVHAWVANYYRVSGGVDYRYNNEWEKQAQWALDLLAKYPELDGVHFDYIRYIADKPEPGVVHQTPDKIEAVTRTVRTAFGAIKSTYPDKFLTAYVFNVDPSWGPIDETTYIPPWFQAWLTAHPDSIFKNPKAPEKVYVPVGFTVGQDGYSWARDEIIDGVMPGGYSPSLELWQRRLPTWESFLGGDIGRVFFGISWLDFEYMRPYPDGKQYPFGGYDPAAVVQQIRYARSRGMRGFVIFQLGATGDTDTPLVNALAVDGPANGFDAPFKQPVPSCLTAGSPTRPSAEIPRAPRRPSVDGLLQEYGQVAGFAFADQSGRSSQDNHTSVKVIWDDDYLYLGLQVADTQLNASVTEVDGPVWGDDAVEVFIDPLLNGGSRFATDDYRIAVNLLNVIADSRQAFDNHHGWDGTADSQVSVDGTLNQDNDVDLGYSVELAIPWVDLGVVPAPGMELGLDVGVDDRDDEASGYQYSDWANLVNFNQPVAWGRIRLSAQQADMPVFADVPFEHPYHDEIETLYQGGYTAGCNTDPLMYCPDATMNRAESAVFVERGIHGTTGLPPQPTTQTFADLPLDSWAAKWAEALWLDGYTAGCGTDPLLYCPWQGHTRAEGCVFYLHMLNGPTYEPPQPSQQTFADVPLETWYAKWVQAGYDAGLLEPCQTTPDLRFCPNDPLSRALAAYMMVQAKGLQSH